jgi:hypothetical protein
MSERFRTPPHWPAAVPPPTTPGWHTHVAAWLADTVPADRWRHNVLADEPWVLALCATATLRRQLDSLRESYRDATRVLADLLPADAYKALLDAHGAEAARLKALAAQVEVVERQLMLMPAARPRR